MGVVLLCVIWAATSTAQDLVEIKYRPEVEKLFDDGVKFYKREDFARARDAFGALLTGDRWHQRLTAALLMHAKASYWLGDYDAATADIRELLSSFPETRYIEHARVLMGLLHHARNDDFNACKQMLWVVEFGNNARLKRRSGELASILMKDYLDLNDILRLKKETAGKDALALVALAEANHRLEAGEVTAAKKLLIDYLKQNPEARYRQVLRTFLADRIEKRSRMNRLGVILPLSGDFAESGRGMYRGIKFAEAENRKRPGGENNEIVVYDSESLMTKAILQLQALVKDPNVVCVVGELENIITAGLAGVAQASGMPFLAPSATDNGIAEIGPFVFQMNPDLETQARFIARYAVDSLKLHTFVTLAPQDEYGRQMVDAFSAEVDRLGGEIMTQRWYYGVPENLSRQFKEIREIAFRRAFEDTVRLVLPNFARLNRDSLWKDFNERFMLDNEEDKPIHELSAKYPVTNIDGVFLPIYQEDIKFVARQLKYFNLDAQILGGEYWYLTDFQKDKRILSYVDGAIFVSSYYYDTEGLAYTNFRNKFRTALGVTPEKWELLGYDTANLLFRALNNGRMLRPEVRDYLDSVSNFFGQSGQVTFKGGHRVNRVANILQIRGERIIKLPYYEFAVK